MKTLIKRLLLPGYDLEKERAIQEAIVALRRLDAENKSLRAKITEMERQKPVAWMNAKRDMTFLYGPYNNDDTPLYALPGARGEEK